MRYHLTYRIEIHSSGNLYGQMDRNGWGKENGVSICMFNGGTR